VDTETLKLSGGRMAGTTETDDSDILSRDIPAAIADAILEHERWLSAWLRAALCRLPASEGVTAKESHLICRFGRWYGHNSNAGLLDGKLFDDLGKMHREMHEAVRYITAKLQAGERLPADEFDAMMDVADKFRKIAVRIQELHGTPEDGAVVADEGLAELQSRLTMLAELEREWERAARTGNPVALVLVRPIGLDAIAKSFGQIGIDRIVASLATRLFAHLRPYDSVFRYGRAEFLICVPDADATRAKSVAARLDELISDSPVGLSDDVELSVAARIGIALTSSKVSVQESLERASHAANMAGNAAGERIVFWEPELEN
jgi:diguanylate cyclase (GGDEF)-like protein